ncbi:CASP C terminal-domain-containing protein [Umbelopsis sp. PMI_123]|nr:CASP C terminal-domain-containing protein [Umbelopsis sp. PMI_123]
MAAEVDSFSSAISFWKNANLGSLQNELDQQGLEIVEKQKDGLISRKKLAEQTRDFKKTSDEEKLQQIKGLLKAYQTEIDSLTKRTKYSENSFLSIYKLLADAPDPTPFLEAAVDQSTKLIDQESLIEENKMLRQQLEEANKQLVAATQSASDASEWKSKYNQLEAKFQDSINEKVEEKEQENKLQMNEKIRLYKEREYDLQKQLSQAHDQLTQLKHSHDDSQARLIDHSSKYDEEVVAKLAELDIVVMDLERANARVIEAQSKNEMLKEEVAKLKSQAQVKESNEAPKQKEAEMTRLISDLENYKDVLQKTEARLGKKIKDLTTQLTAKSTELDAIRESMKKYEDYEEIKRELEIMKYVEFSTGDDDDGDQFDAEGVLKTSQDNRDSLEVRLMTKNKRLENTNTAFKSSLADSQKELEATRMELEAVRKTVEEQKLLIEKLEEDVYRMDQSKSEAGSGILTQSSSTANLNFLSQPSANSPRASIDVTSREDKSILPIITGQRDRFRQRNSQLEEELKKQESNMEDLRGEVEMLKQDNLKLYEKLKFVHVWKEERVHGKQGNSAVVNMNSDSAGSPYRRGGEGTSNGKYDDPSDKYGKLYEENMNPFTQFHRREENRRYQSLNPAEKVTLSLTRLFVSNKWSRYFFIIYSLLLHLLVMVTLYQLSLWEECRHDHETPNFANPMGMNDNGEGMAGAMGGQL